MDWCWNSNYKLSTFVRGLRQKIVYVVIDMWGCHLIKAPTSLFMPWVFHHCRWDWTIEPPSFYYLIAPIIMTLKFMHKIHNCVFFLFLFIRTFIDSSCSHLTLSVWKNKKTRQNGRNIEVEKLGVSPLQGYIMLNIQPRMINKFWAISYFNIF